MFFLILDKLLYAIEFASRKTLANKSILLLVEVMYEVMRKIIHG